MIAYFDRFSRRKKKLLLAGYDTACILLSVLLAGYIRTGDLLRIVDAQSWLGIVAVTGLTLFCFIRLGLYRAVLRYLGYKAIKTVILGCLLSATILALTSFLTQAQIPRSTPLIYFLCLLVFVGGARYVYRAQYLIHVKRDKVNVLIFGAGSTGIQLCSASDQGNEFNPVGFIDDDPAKQGTIINGVRVYPRHRMTSIISDYDVKEILVALPKESRDVRNHVLSYLESFPLRVRVVPAFDQWASPSDDAAIGVRDVELEDLLGRDPIESDHALMAKSIAGKVVMVTGAGGSIGSELCRQIIKQSVATLVLFEHSEYNLYRIEQELRNMIQSTTQPITLVPILGNIQNKSQLRKVLTAFRVQTLYHAAAYKHVPLVEDNVLEGIRNNIFGTLNVAQAAVACGVERFVLISTDKAVRPTNVMGATKRVAELVLQLLAQQSTLCVFSMVRFGNVLGSSGSVVPLFRKQILSGGPVTVTHPEIIRYFMTIPEAASLVIQAGAMAEGGEVFLLDMGAPVKIYDLAVRMIHLMGQQLQTTDGERKAGQIAIDFTGLRPGEKLFEELLVDESAEGTDHPRIMKAREKRLSRVQVHGLLDQLDKACKESDSHTAVQLLRDGPLGYKPPTTELSCHVPGKDELAKKPRLVS